MKLLTRGSTPRTIRACARKRGICGPCRKINRASNATPTAIYRFEHFAGLTASLRMKQSI
jgi:hypothetical protein